MSSVTILYFLVASASLGIFYNTVGEKFVFLLLTLFTISRKNFRVNKKLLISTLLFLGYVIAKSMDGMSFQPSGEYHSLWVQQVKIIELSGTFIMFCSLRTDRLLQDDKILLNCRKIFDFCYYFTIIITIFMLIFKGRLIYRSNPSDVGVIFASQSFLYYAIIVGAVLAEKLAVAKRKQLKYLTGIILNALFVILMSYTTQMLFFFLATGIVFFVNIIKRKRDILVMMVLCIAVFLIVFKQIPFFLTMLSTTVFAENGDVSMRLNELAELLSGNGITGLAIAKRMEVFSLSMRTFKDNILFGVPFSNYNKGGVLVIGGHQEWGDNLARYGLIGTALYTLFIYNGFTRGLGILEKADRKIIVLSILFLLYGFLNPFIQLSFITACIFGLLIDKTNVFE